MISDICCDAVTKRWEELAVGVRLLAPLNSMDMIVADAGIHQVFDGVSVLDSLPVEH